MLDACRHDYVNKENTPFIYSLISKGSYYNKLILDLNNKFNLISTPIAYLNEVEGINNAGDIVKISNILKYINMNECKKLYLPKIDL